MIVFSQGQQNDYLILPGRSIGRLTLETPIGEIVKEFGEDYQKLPISNLRGATSHWWEKRGWAVYVCNEGQRIPLIGIYRHENEAVQAELGKYHTREGIGFNTSFAEMEKVFGQPTSSFKMMRRGFPNNDVKLYGNLGLFAEVEENGRIYALGVYRRYRCP